jgi:hypothetical protein
LGQGDYTATSKETCTLPAKYPELDSPITIEEVTETMKKLKRNKAAGIDGITAELICDAANVLTEPLAMVFNFIFENGYPAGWAVGVLHPIFKAGDINDPGNYPGICVGIIIGKLFAMILYSRITDWAENQGIRAKGQAGFRRDHRTTDHIFVMRTLIEKTRKMNKGKLYCCFVDFKKAFDTIPRHLLWQELAGIGITGKMLTCIQSMYANDSARIFNAKQGLTDEFLCQKGVKQGCPLSPTLFGLYIDKIESRILEISDQSSFPELGGMKVPLLLYADDLAIFSHSPNGLQQQLSVLQKFCHDFQLTVNSEKTKILVFEKGKSDCQDFLYNGSPIGRVDSFKYLGIEFHGTKGFLPATDQLRSAATKSLFALLQRCGELHISDPKTKCDLFDSLVAPILQYSCEVWAVDHKEGNCKLELVQREFLRKILGVNVTTPNSSVLGEFGRLPLRFRWWKQILNYWKRLESSSDRLIYGAYQESKKMHIEKGYGWYTSLITWVRSNSGHNGGDIDVEKIMKAATTAYMDKTCQNVGTKHLFYKSVKQFQPYEFEPYLTLDNFFYRQIMAQIRTGTNFLEVDLGRRTIPFTEHDDRKCSCCNRGDVEDEHHFIFICEAYESIRVKYADLVFEQRDLKSFFLKGDNKRVARFLTECRNIRSSMQ